MTTATVSAPVQSTYNYFDPIELVQDVTNPIFKATVISSYLWTLSANVVNKSRSLFFKLRETSNKTENSIDEFNEFCAAVSEAKANAQYNNELGFEENTHLLTELSMLHALRQQCFDYAETTHAAAGLQFKYKTYDELVISTEPAKTDKSTEDKTKLLATMLSGEDAEIQERMTSMLLKKHEATLKDRHDLQNMIAPAVSNLITMAAYRDIDDVQFYQLPIDTQRMLITRMHKIMGDKLEQLSGWRSISVTDYAIIIAEGLRTQRTLADVLKAPKFAVAD